MNGLQRLSQTFRALRRHRRAALIPFVMAGDPSLAATGELIRVLAEAGADLIEIGIPFSDPLADGSTIQRAATAALAHGTTPRAVLKLIERVAPRVHVPLAILSYWNPMLQYDHGRVMAMDARAFLRAASAAGVCGIITPDLPLEEALPFRLAARPCGLASILLAAPTSPPARLRHIVRASEGFVYYVSVTGTTGARHQLAPEWRQHVRQLKLITTKPICVGFGISTPRQAAEVGRVADGVIVGSALIRALAPYARQRRVLLRRAETFMRAFREVL